MVIILVLCLSIFLWYPAAKKLSSWLANLLKPWQFKSIEWLFAILLSTIGIWFINTHVFSFYTLRSSSMRPSYDNNELVFINKLAYGAATNINTPHRYKRLKGYSEMTKGDVLAFHFPEADTSFVDYPDEDYYFIKRQYENTGKYTPILDAKVQFNNVSERKIFIKRLIAVPGDTLQYINGQYFINHVKSPFNSHCINKYEIKTDTPTAVKHDIRKYALTSYRENGSQLIEMKADQVNKNNWNEYLLPIEETLNMPNIYVFPFKQNYFWNASYLGPIIIPTKDKTVRLTLTNVFLYKRIIESYEGNQLSIQEKQIFINGKLSNEYTFKMNYYWVAGDNKFHSFDSRYWGFVPENHIIGRVDKL